MVIRENKSETKENFHSVFKVVRKILFLLTLAFSPLLRSLSLSSIFLHRRPIHRKRTILQNTWWERNLKKIME